MFGAAPRSTLLLSSSFVDSDAGYLDHIRPLRNPRCQQALDLFGRTDARLDPRDAQPPMNAVVFEGASDLGLELAENWLRRPRRGKERIARRHVIVPESALPDRRYVRQLARAHASGDGQGAQLARLNLRQHGGDGRNPKRDSAPEQIGDRRGADPIRNVDHVDAGEPLEQFAVEMSRRAVPGRPE